MTNALNVEALRNSLNINAQARSEYEASKDSNEKITSQLIKTFSLDHKSLETTLTDAYLQKLIDAQAITSFDFINDQEKANQRFNIKALAKVRAKLDSIVQDKIINQATVSQKFCIACALTCIRNKDQADFAFTRKHALAMLSKALRFDTVRVKDLATKFDVSESTASTQVSSSFRTLAALDVLRFSEETKQRAVVSAVNYDHAFIKMIERDMLERR